MKKCKNCGTTEKETTFICSKCGSNVFSESFDENQLTWKHYIDNNADSVQLKRIREAAILLYICVGISLVTSIGLFSVDLGTAITSIIENLLVLVVTLGFHLKKSRACSMIAFIYSLVVVVINLFTGGFIGGLLRLIAGISEAKAFEELRKDYKNMRKPNLELR